MGRVIEVSDGLLYLAPCMERLVCCEKFMLTGVVGPLTLVDSAGIDVSGTAPPGEVELTVTCPQPPCCLLYL